MDIERAPVPADAGPEADAPARITPMMEQYIEIKAANPDCLLFYRMGDFYELFFDDAETASRALGIVLTKRGKHLGRDIPMCGVPVERAEEYLHRLIALGHRVAVCEQIEDPSEARKRGSKSLVRRDVTRLVTPGTLTEDTLLEARRNNWLVTVARGRPASDAEALFGIAWLDISTGEFFADRMRPRAAWRGARPARARRSGACRQPLRGRGAQTAVALFGGNQSGRPRPVRRRDGGPKARCFLQRGDGQFLRRVLAPRAFRGGCGGHLCRPHAARQAPGAFAALARGRGLARHRRAHARQSRIDPHACRRNARLALVRDRSHHDRGRRAHAFGAAREPPDRARCDQRPARCGGALGRGRAPPRRIARSARQDP